MNRDVKALWISALRSGDYKQGRTALYDPTTGCHCADGVLCELAAQAGVVVRNEDGRYADPADPDTTARHLLPVAVLEWAGLNALTYPSVRIGETVHPTFALNDNGKSFREIADLLEAAKGL